MSIYMEEKRAKHKDTLLLPDGAQETLMALLRQNAGAASYRMRDPVYALSESFAQTFDRIGRFSTMQEEQRRAQLQMQRTQDANPLQSFATYAFQNGHLAAAILQGQGKLVLQACISRAYGKSGGSATAQRTSVDVGAPSHHIPHSADALQANDDVHSAVALALGAAQQASEVLRTIRTADTVAQHSDVTTLHEIFPFLFTEQDHALLMQLTAKRRTMQQSHVKDDPQYRVVTQAITKARNVLAKKEQMKTAFLAQLDRMLANAKAFELLLSEVKLPLHTDVLQAQGMEAQDTDTNIQNSTKYD